MLYPPSLPGNVDNFPAQTTLPDDGAELEAADLNVAVEALTDRTAYLKARGFIDVYSFATDTEIAPSATVESFAATGSTYKDSAILRIDVQSCEVGDVVLVDASMPASFTGANAGSFCFLRIAATQGQGGNAPSTANLPGALMFFQGTSLYQSTTFSAEVRVTTAGTVRVFARAKTFTDKLEVLFAAKIRAVRMRRF